MPRLSLPLDGVLHHARLGGAAAPHLPHACFSVLLEGESPPPFPDSVAFVQEGESPPPFPGWFAYQSEGESPPPFPGA